MLGVTGPWADRTAGELTEIASPDDGPVVCPVMDGSVMIVLKSIQSTAKRLLGAGCAGLSCLFAIALMACGGDTPPTKSPASGSTDTPAIAYASVSAGWTHTCGVKTDGSVECWGDDAYGQATPP